MTLPSDKPAPGGRHLGWTGLFPWRGSRKQQATAIVESGLFDGTWYLSHYPDVAPTGTDPLSHYLALGVSEGRDPNPLFGTAWYLFTYPDVAAAGVDPLLHYLRSGAAEGRDPHPLFDTDWYLSRYPDVAAAGMNPLSHYLRQGAAEGCDPHPLFDAAWYLSTNPEVAVAGTNPLLHYLRQGAAEGRDPHPLFDTDWYLSMYPDVAAAGVNPLSHYLRSGAAEGRDPNPLFDTDWYLSSYPDVVTSGVNPLEHYVRWGVAERRNPGPHFDTAKYLTAYPDVAALGTNPLAHYLKAIQKKRHTVIAALEKVKWAEPLLQQITPDQLSVLRVDARDQGLPPYYPAFRKLFLSLDHSFDHIVFIRGLTHEEADLEAIHALRAAQERHGTDAVLLVITDQDLLPLKHWLPAGTHLRTLSAHDRDLSPWARMMIVRTLIQTLWPKAVLNVNSRACWEVFMLFGAPLSHTTDLYAMLFQHDADSESGFGGYAAEFFRDCLPHLRRIYTDNAAFLCDLKQRFGIPPMYFPKLDTLYQPWETTMLPAGCKPYPPPPEDGTFRVFWAGRICHQRNPQLLLEIARRCPGFTFDVYGTCDKKFKSMMSEEAPPNVLVKGPCSDMGAIPVANYQAFLYTSLQDDLPNALIAAGTLEVPVVASGLDAIVELIDDTTGWPVHNFVAADGYAEALERIQSDPTRSSEKARVLRQRIATRHSWESYMACLSQSPSFID